MTRYWIKIAAGALLIFAAGMVVWTLGRKGATAANSVFNSADPISIPLKFVDFRVDGSPLGKIQRLTLLRTAPEEFTSVEVTVRLDSAAAAERLGSCVLRLEDLEHLDENTTFICATPETPAGAEAFEPFGQVRIQGSDVTIPLMLPSAVVKDLKSKKVDVQVDTAPVVPDPPSPPAGGAASASSGAAAAVTP